MSKKTEIFAKIPDLILASGSPRRAALLDGLGIQFAVEKPNVDESRLPDEPPRVMVERLARLKCRSVNGPTPILAADTIVVFDGHILGKPRDSADALRMLHLLSGNTHEVMTGFCLRSGESFYSEVVTSIVEFRSLGASEIQEYINSGEPMDKAGAYAIQGKAGLWVEKLAGSLTNVIGLPMKEVWAAMANLGILI